MGLFQAQLSLVNSSFANFTYTPFNSSADIDDIVYATDEKYLLAFEFFTDVGGQPGGLGLSRPKV